MRKDKEELNHTPVMTDEEMLEYEHGSFEDLRELEQEILEKHKNQILSGFKGVVLAIPFPYKLPPHIEKPIVQGVTELITHYVECVNGKAFIPELPDDIH